MELGLRRPRPEIEATIDHLIESGYLQEVAGSIILGREGQRRFGGSRGLASLLATFSGTAGASVVGPGDGPVGHIDWQQAEVGRELLLAGRAWRVTSVHRDRGQVLVEPSTEGRPLSWRGPSHEVERPSWEAVREILAGTDVPVAIDKRGTGWVEAARLAWAPRIEHPVRATAGGAEVDAFAGDRVHRSVLAILDVDGRAEGTGFVATTAPRELAARSEAALADMDRVLHREALRLAPSLVPANPELTAPSVLLAEVGAFEVDRAGIRSVLTLLAAWPS